LNLIKEKIKVERKVVNYRESGTVIVAKLEKIKRIKKRLKVINIS